MVGKEQYQHFGEAKPKSRPESNVNFWRELDTRVMARKPINLKLPEMFAKEEWSKIPVEICKKNLSPLIKTIVIENKGVATDY